MKLWVSKHPYGCRTTIPINGTPTANLLYGVGLWGLCHMGVVLIVMGMDQRSMDRKLRSLTIVYSTNAANGPICAKFRTQISLNITVTSVKLRAFLVDE